MNSKNFLIDYKTLNNLEKDGVLKDLMNSDIYKRYLEWARNLTDSQINENISFDVCQECSSGLESYYKIQDFLDNLQEDGDYESGQQIEEAAEKL